MGNNILLGIILFSVPRGDFPQLVFGPSGLVPHFGLAPKCLNASMGVPLLWGLTGVPECFVWLASFLGLVSGPVNLIFRTLSVSPSPCVRRTWARDVMCLASGAISMRLLEAGLIKA